MTFCEATIDAARERHRLEIGDVLLNSGVNIKR